MKRVIPVFLTVVMIIASMLCVTAKETYKFGDVNKDGVISVMDVTLIQCYLAGLIDKSEIDVLLADVDGDDNVSIIDATLVQLYLAQIIDKFPGGSVIPTPPSVDSDGYYDQIVKP